MIASEIDYGIGRHGKLVNRPVYRSLFPSARDGATNEGG